MFKAPMVGMEIIVFSYGKPKDSASFIKSNKVLYIYLSINFKAGVPMAVRDIISVRDPDLTLPEDPDDTVGKVTLL